MVSLNQFHEYLNKKNFTITHWSLPKIQLKLSKIEDGKYLLNCYGKDGELFQTNEHFNFQIHYGEQECLCGLFVKSGDRGWFLETMDIFEETNIGIGIIAMFRNRRELMKEIYDRECKQ